MPIIPILEIIAILLAALVAPAWAIARVSSLGGRERRALQRLLKRYEARGHVLRYEGESEDIAIARLERMIWLAEDAPAALRHMLRRYGCVLARARMGFGLAPCDRPPLLPAAALSAACAGAPEAADTS